MRKLAVKLRKGRRLSKNDHIVTWTKAVRPEWMDEDVYDDEIPDKLMLREIKISDRKKSKVLVTTLGEEYSKEEIIKLYMQRWNIELDFRSIKETMQMGILRGKTPAMVRKEVWMYLVGYNLIRWLIASAAYAFKKIPRMLSFKAAMQATNSLLEELTYGCSKTYCWLMNMISKHRVGNRPGRIEPRLVKRRPKPFRNLREPREQARQRIRKSYA